MPKKGTRFDCPKCGVYGKLERSIVGTYIALKCQACGHQFKSRSQVARQHVRAEEARRKLTLQDLKELFRGTKP